MIWSRQRANSASPFLTLRRSQPSQSSATCSASTSTQSFRRIAWWWRWCTWTATTWGRTNSSSASTMCTDFSWLACLWRWSTTTISTSTIWRLRGQEGWVPRNWWHSSWKFSKKSVSMHISRQKNITVCWTNYPACTAISEWLLLAITPLTSQFFKIIHQFRSF